MPRDIITSFSSSRHLQLARFIFRFCPAREIGITLVADKTYNLTSLFFPQGVIVDPVLVTAIDTPVVDTTPAVVGSTVTTHEAESLPVGSRSPLDLIFTLPGVSEEPLSTRGSG